MWQRVKDWCWNSVTVFWSYVLLLSGSIGNILTDLDVKNAIQQLGVPKYVWLGVTVIGAITLASRLKSKLSA